MDSFTLLFLIISKAHQVIHPAHGHTAIVAPSHKGSAVKPY